MVGRWDAADVSVWLDSMGLDQLKPRLRGMTGRDLLAATQRTLADVGVKGRTVSVLRSPTTSIFLVDLPPGVTTRTPPSDVRHTRPVEHTRPPVHSHSHTHIHTHCTHTQAEKLLGARRQLFNGATAGHVEEARGRHHHRHGDGKRRVALIRRPRSVEAFDPLRMRWPEAVDPNHATKRRTFVIKECVLPTTSKQTTIHCCCGRGGG
jgi:hypothetical protein